MNPEHAVDIYADFITGEMVFLRRRDSSIYALSCDPIAKDIGHAAFEAIEPAISNDLSWREVGDEWSLDWDQFDIAVAWRADGEIVIATPFCNWGKAPDIKISNQPSYLEFGTAIVEQLQYAKTQREKMK